MKINELPEVMVSCLTITSIVELLIALILGVRDKKDFLNIFLVNVLTNPIAVSLCVYINVHYGLMARNICVAIFEVIIFMVEGFIYKKVLKYNKINPFIFSLILNACSYLIGEII